MANPEDYGINPREIVERLAAEDGIAIETPHKVTPGTAKLLAMKSIYAAFETMQSPHAIDDTKPRVYLTQLGILRNIDGTDPFSRIQDGIRQRIRAGEIDATLPDLVGPNVPEARIKSSKIEGEQSL